MRLLVCAGMMIVLASACAPQPEVVLRQNAPAMIGDVFAPGARVRVKSRSGTFKPSETGHLAEVNVTAGKTGVVVQGIGEIARVRFDAQMWEEFPPTGAMVQLKEFEATIHVSYLQAVR